jgi:transcription antitermination factor NusG
MPDEAQDRCLKQGVPKLPVIALDYGNKTNYRTYEEVLISAFPEGENEILIYQGDEVIETVTISGRGNISRKFPRGYYQIKHTATGECLEFSVTQPEITHFVENGKITVKADACDIESVISHFEFREMTRSEREKLQGKDPENNAVAFYSDSCAALSKMEELTAEEKKTGIITREIPADAANFKVSFENKYGIWTHTMIRI